MTEKQEIWRKINGFPNYEVSNLGNVRNKKTGRVLRPSKDGCGYSQVILCKDGKGNQFKVHRLVATAFIPNPKNKKEVNHIDGNKSNNYVDNLEWNTHSENQQHSIKTGLRTKSGLPKQKCRCIETNQEFESLLSASKYFSCDHGSIRNSIHTGHKVKGKYHFESA